MREYISLIIREELKRADELGGHSEKMQELIDAADLHPEFAGYDLVRGPTRDAARLFITNEMGEPVGFMTPRKDSGFWRTGAIYVDPAARGKGYAKQAIIDFFSDPNHRPARVWIADNNTESQRAFTAAGFEVGEQHDLGASDSDKGKHYYLK